MNKNILILGENKRNNWISEFFAKEGYHPIIIDDVFRLRSLDGEVGRFTAQLKDQTVQADLVVLTEQPSAPPVTIDGLVARTIYHETKALLESKGDGAKPMVFLLDYICESPLSATICALREAKALANNKRQVYYLAKFIRTGGLGIEKLYGQAREAGVTFIKYENLELSGNEDSREFSITGSDGVLEFSITTKLLFADGSLETGESFSYVAEKLKLTLNEQGRLAEDTYYLAPALTGRRGVYYISRDLEWEKLEAGLEDIVALANSGIWTKPSLGVATVEGEKCVLCLNCLRACTHGALTPDSTARLMNVFDLACEGCGSCASICPGNAITLEQEAKDDNGITLGQEGKSNKSITFGQGVKGENSIAFKQKKTEDSTSGISHKVSHKVLVLCCENSAAVAMGKVLPTLGKDATRIKTKSVPCGGRISLEQLSEDLAFYHKVMVAVCMNEACRHFDGNKRCCGQVKRLKEMLESVGLSSDLVGITYTSHAMPKALREDLIDLLREDSP